MKALGLLKYYLLIILLLSRAAMADIPQEQYASVELISSAPTIAPGQSFQLGLVFTMQPHWHIYWENPGDSGAAPTVNWIAPEGFQFSPVQWPIPSRLTINGITNYIYEKQVVLPVTVTPPEKFQSNIPDSIQIKAEVDWLICKIKCIPESQDLTIDLPVKASTTPPENAPLNTLFTAVQKQLPAQHSLWKMSGIFDDEKMLLTVTPPASPPTTFQPDTIDFFPLTRPLIQHSVLPEISVTATGDLQILLALNPQRGDMPDFLDGVLTVPEPLAVSIPLNPGSVPAFYSSSQTATAAATQTATSTWMALFFAFLGGLILNLMPCVLPVLSLKILGIVQHARESRAHILRQGTLFSAGIIVTFWFLGAGILVLKAAGHELGWGFQLQSPGFVSIVSIIIFLMGLSLIGLFEINVSAGNLSNQTGSNGDLSSFLNGVVATIVATPCTAPFMGSAMGFALFQPAWVSMGVFTALGVGMAAPLFLVSLWPRLARWVPGPGPWMEILKESMGFMLLGTAVWLAWIVSRLTGADGTIRLLVMWLITGVSIWVYSRWGGPDRSRKMRQAGKGIAGLILVTVAYIGATGFTLSSPVDAPETTSSIHWEPWSEQEVNSARQAQQPVFINFTASWCLSCQVNKKVALTNRSVEDAFSQAGVRTFVADWTAQDPGITKALESYGRNSVPLYVLYLPGQNNPVFLPEILTPGTVTDVLRKIPTHKEDIQ